MKNFQTLRAYAEISKLKAWAASNPVKLEAKKSADKNELHLFGPIVDASTAEFFGLDSLIDDLSVAKALAEFEPGAELQVLINSPGGDAWTGISIYNLIKAQGNAHVRVTGIAASAASIVAMAGKTLTMDTGSTLMIHKAWTIAIGNERELTESANRLRTLDQNLVDIYHDRTGIDRDEIMSMLDPDTYMSASQAEERGFADTKDTKREPSGRIEKALIRRWV